MTESSVLIMHSIFNNLTPLLGPRQEQINRYICVNESHYLCEKDKAQCPCGSNVDTAGLCDNGLQSGTPNDWTATSVEDVSCAAVHAIRVA